MVQNMIPSIITDNIEIDEHTKCWNWTAGASGGYAHAYVKGKMVRVARWLYCLIHKTNPPVIMHLCNNKLCVNPNHLLGATHAENRQHYCDNDSIRSQTVTTKKRLEAINIALNQLGEQHG